MNYLLPHSVLNAANKFPDKVAFTDGHNSYTYTELSNQMDQLANWLVAQGLQKGDRVGIYLNRCLETALAMYGIMRAGGVYVPLDPKANAERTQFLIENCQIKILISQAAQKRKLINISKGLPSLECIIGFAADELTVAAFGWEVLQKQAKTFTATSPILEQDLAYIIYTSGSTGEPKGIMHTHYSGMAYARLTASLYDLQPADKIGNHAPIHFDISLLGYFTGPFLGATTLIASDAHTIFPVSLGSLLAEEKITVWYSVPLALIQLLQANALEAKNLESLRWILYAGEAFPPALLRELMLTLPKAQVSNIYGPAETNQCTYYNLPGIPDGENAIPIGQVWDNTEYLLIDGNDELVPEGSVGELLIRSATMMMGYWQKPALTDRSFFSLNNEHGVARQFYRTGDLSKVDEAGVMHFLGRKDHQIKIRGYRVELDAIEILLCSHEAVAEAAVIPMWKNGNVESIEAAVLLQAKATVDEKELMLFLKQKLPAHAVPASLKILAEFPRSSNGKIERKALLPVLQNSNV